MHGPRHVMMMMMGRPCAYQIRSSNRWAEIENCVHNTVELKNPRDETMIPPSSRPLEVSRASFMWTFIIIINSPRHSMLPNDGASSSPSIAIPCSILITLQSCVCAVCHASSAALAPVCVLCFLFRPSTSRPNQQTICFGYCFRPFAHSFLFVFALHSLGPPRSIHSGIGLAWSVGCINIRPKSLRSIHSLVRSLVLLDFSLAFVDAKSEIVSLWRPFLWYPFININLFGFCVFFMTVSVLSARSLVFVSPLILPLASHDSRIHFTDFLRRDKHRNQRPSTEQQTPSERWEWCSTRPTFDPSCF